jgi:hypothetical protein
VEKARAPIAGPLNYRPLAAVGTNAVRTGRAFLVPLLEKKNCALF